MGQFLQGLAANFSLLTQIRSLLKKSNFRNMLDQDTTTVITTIIAVVGTLGGVVLGVTMTNRSVTRQEKVKQREVPLKS
jgi:hypothetical protein